MCNRHVSVLESLDRFSILGGTPGVGSDRPRCASTFRLGSFLESLRPFSSQRGARTDECLFDLAGEHFREDADRLEKRLWGANGTDKRYKVEAQASAPAEVVASEAA